MTLTPDELSQLDRDIAEIVGWTELEWRDVHHDGSTFAPARWHGINPQGRADSFGAGLWSRNVERALSLFEGDDNFDLMPSGDEDHLNEWEAAYALGTSAGHYVYVTEYDENCATAICLLKRRVEASKSMPHPPHLHIYDEVSAMDAVAWQRIVKTVMGPRVSIDEPPWPHEPDRNNRIYSREALEAWAKDGPLKGPLIYITPADAEDLRLLRGEDWNASGLYVVSERPPSANIVNSQRDADASERAKVLRRVATAELKDYIERNPPMPLSHGWDDDPFAALPWPPPAPYIGYMRDGDDNIRPIAPHAADVQAADIWAWLKRLINRYFGNSSKD